MRTVTGLPVAGSLPSSRACATSSRETFFSIRSTWSDEGLPELVERPGPLLLAARDRVELVLHGRREAVLHVAMEVMGQEAVDDLADVGRHEAPLVHLHVLPVLQGRDDGGVGGGTADPMLLQRLHQRGFAVARRRLREMLIRVQRDQVDDIALLQRRQHVIVFVRLRVVRAFLINGDESRLHQRGAVGAQHVALRAIRRRRAYRPRRCRRPLAPSARRRRASRSSAYSL